MKYDSAHDTVEHRHQVRLLIQRAMGELLTRAMHHDDSKLLEPEKSVFDIFTPLLKDSTYGTPEYHEILRAMAPALKHHYEANGHHPEHYPNGINGMTLFDVVEMLCDWKAAGMRHANGSMAQSLEVNRKRFDISDQLFEILQNTVKAFDW